VVKEILDFGKEKEDTRLSRWERERIYQERKKVEEEAKAKQAENEEAEKNEEGSQNKVSDPHLRLVHGLTFNAWQGQRLTCDTPGFSVERGQARVINTKYHSVCFFACSSSYSLIIIIIIIIIITIITIIIIIIIIIIIMHNRHSFV